MWSDIDHNQEWGRRPKPWTGKDSAAASDFFLSRGWSYYRVQQTLRLVGADEPGSGRRAFFFALIAWLPLVALAGAQGLAINDAPHRSLLMDFTVYARFLVAIPLFVLGERIADFRFALIVNYLVRSEIVADSERQSYIKLLSGVRRLRNSRVVEVSFVIIAFAIAGYSAVHQIMSGSSTWLSPNPGGAPTISWAGVWYTVISLPIFEFLLYRALWIWVLWCFFLWRLSRLDLQLRPTHPDLAGGLGILGDTPYTIAVFVFTIGMTLSAEWANQIVYDQVPVFSFSKVFIVYLLLTLLFTFGPLLIFIGKLDRFRMWGMQTFGALVCWHAQLFEDKWIRKIGATEGIEESPLGSPDMSSLIDLNSSYEFAKNMRLFPFGLRALIAIAVASLLPMIPLIMAEIPLKEILRLIANTFL